MQSALTRSVFRRILRNEAIVHPDCLYRRPGSVIRNGRCSNNVQSRRTLFGFRTLYPRESLNRKGGKDPGMRQLIDASKKQELRIRMPPAADIADAWKAYFQDKFDKNELIRDAHARHAYSAFQYIQTTQKAEEPLLLNADDMATALNVLGSRATGKKMGDESDRLDPSYIKLAHGLYRGLCEQKVHAQTQHDAVKRYMKLLCFSSYAQDAQDLILSGEVAQSLDPRQAWHYVILGFVAERNVDALRSMAQRLEDAAPQLVQELSPVLTQAFAVMDAMEDAKRFYSNISMLKPTKFEPEDYYMAILTAANRNNDIEWGRSVVQKLLDTPGITTTHRRHWDAIFVWAAGSGKSVDEVDRMMEVMVRRNPDFTPDTTTMNKLISYAVSRNDAYLAERFLSLGAKWRVEPDPHTYLLQMDYRLSNGDVDGAITAFRHLQDWELPNQEDVPRINRLIQAMCSSGKHSFESIMAIVDVLNRRRAYFEADTTAALSILHLKRDEYHDVVDLLRTQAGNYDSIERIRIRDAFVNVCLDRRNSVARVWDTYMIFHQVFDAETKRDVRTAIMNEFLARRRSDMAVHVFNHMRDHTREDTRATLATYADIYVGIGRLADDESLEVVHNQMKLDMHMEPNTRLHNACMLAFLGCSQPRGAFQFWKDIIASAEGPSYNSLLIVMRVCERMPFGEKEARAIWKQIRTLDVEITRELLGGYVGALAGNDLVDEAMGVVEGAEREYGIVPDAVVIGSMYNAIRNPMIQRNLESWIRSKFEDVWEELERIGFRDSRMGTRRVKVTGDLQP